VTAVIYKEKKFLFALVQQINVSQQKLAHFVEHVFLLLNIKLFENWLI
jgi:hypothetical protein